MRPPSGPPNYIFVRGSSPDIHKVQIIQRHRFLHQIGGKRQVNFLDKSVNAEQLAANIFGLESY